MKWFHRAAALVGTILINLAVFAQVPQTSSIDLSGAWVNGGTQGNTMCSSSPWTMPASLSAKPGAYIVLPGTPHV